LKLLDEPTKASLRAIALRAVAGRFEPEVVDGLIARLRHEPNATQRRELADLLTRVYKKPGAWTYWGFRPPPRPPNSVAWARTEVIEKELDHVLHDADRMVRLETLRRMTPEKVPARTASLTSWLQAERKEEYVAAILAALSGRPAEEIRPHLESILRDTKHAPANRLAAASLFLQDLGAHGEEQLLA